jgi:hypothetical protein
MVSLPGAQRISIEEGALMPTDVQSAGAHLQDVIDRASPAGPSATEDLLDVTENLLDTSAEVFGQLYDATNHTHRSTRADAPSYIVGRKGAGKTAFLIGAALAGNADVVLVKSEHIYTEVNRLRSRYSAQNGALVADTLAYVWEVLLVHAAMWQIAKSKRLANSRPRQRVWSYIQTFGDPLSMGVDRLLARVTAKLTQAVLTAPDDLSFEEACWSLSSDGRSFTDAARDATEVLAAARPNALYVVVDNLEDLHNHLDDFAEVIRALFRVTTRNRAGRRDRRLPFTCRFAFPAELVPRLRILTANPEKDFLDYLVIRWTAPELVVVVGNRLRIFLDLYFPKAPRRLGLPSQRDAADREAAVATLRAILPEQVTNGFGGTENPVAYLLRHTQLLPRHLIQMVNEIMQKAVADPTDPDVPRAAPRHVIEGVRHAERRIVDGILTTYSDQYPLVADALMAIKNHFELVENVRDLHRLFNHASVARVGVSFEEFLDALLAIGALGVVTHEDPKARYVRAEFSYTFTEDVRPIEASDRVCVHPLFIYRLFDRRRITTMAGIGTQPVYPYGSDLDDDEHDI